MIRCRCLLSHPDHEFRAGTQPILCGTCSHNLAAHIAIPEADNLVRLIGVMDVQGWTMTPTPDGIDVLIHLTPTS